MRIKRTFYGDTKFGGTLVWLSADDTYRWAHRSGSSWPLSRLSGHRLFVSLDDKGDLVDYTVDGRSGRDIPADEMDAILSDTIGDAHLTGSHAAVAGAYRHRGDRAARHRLGPVLRVRE